MKVKVLEKDFCATSEKDPLKSYVCMLKYYVACNDDAEMRAISSSR